jgi:hypothetical protein
MTLAGRLATNPLAASKPELSVTLKGPLASPERTVDLSALLGWLTLRSTELQTRRLQSLEANGRQDMPSPVVRPGSPAVRFLPLGTVLESAASTHMPAPRGVGTAERLQPSPPAAVLPDDTHSDLGGTTGHGAAAANALPPATPPPAASSRPDNAAAITGTASPAPRRAGAPPAAPPPRAAAPATRSPLDLLFGSHN